MVLVSLPVRTIRLPCRELTTFRPQHLESMKDIRRGEDNDLVDAEDIDPELVPGRAAHRDTDYEPDQTKLLKNSRIAQWDDWHSCSRASHFVAIPNVWQRICFQ